MLGLFVCLLWGFNPELFATLIGGDARLLLGACILLEFGWNLFHGFSHRKEQQP